jgi:hypothetical protein
MVWGAFVDKLRRGAEAMPACEPARSPARPIIDSSSDGRRLDARIWRWRWGIRARLRPLGEVFAREQVHRASPMERSVCRTDGTKNTKDLPRCDKSPNSQTALLRFDQKPNRTRRTCLIGGGRDATLARCFELQTGSKKAAKKAAKRSDALADGAHRQHCCNPVSGTISQHPRAEIMDWVLGHGCRCTLGLLTASICMPNIPLTSDQKMGVDRPPELQSANGGSTSNSTGSTPSSHFAVLPEEHPERTESAGGDEDQRPPAHGWPPCRWALRHQPLDGPKPKSLVQCGV